MLNEMYLFDSFVILNCFVVYVTVVILILLFVNCLVDVIVL